MPLRRHFSREQTVCWRILPCDDLVNNRLHECPAAALLPRAIWSRAGHAVGGTKKGKENTQYENAETLSDYAR